jgi:hypothetical protein
VVPNRAAADRAAELQLARATHTTLGRRADS